MHTKGYKTVSLTKDGKTKTLFVHRLVAEAFIPNADNLPMVNHKDEDKTNNFVENLEWCTNDYNINYGTARRRQAKKIYITDVFEESSKSLVEDINKNFAPVAEFCPAGDFSKVKEATVVLNASGIGMSKFFCFKCLLHKQ